MTKQEILAWLHENNAGKLKELWAQADQARKKHVGDEVHLRGLIEISNHCIRLCGYCGLRADHQALGRYRMTPDEVLESARKAAAFGYGTVVLQGGEDPGLTQSMVADIVTRIKSEAKLAVTLSLGERSDEDLAAWKKAGADRYLLRFETSDLALFKQIHPNHGNRESDRIAMLRRLKKMGFETGSGILLGLPGQTYESVANDLLLFAELDLDMIGIGPFIPHPATPLAQSANEPTSASIPNTELMVYKVMALTRLVRPDANIPSTTALATINKANGRELGLQRGANVVMPNLTPLRYRKLYEIYPAKACIDDTAEACNGCLRMRIASIGRSVGKGAGGRKKQNAC